MIRLSIEIDTPEELATALLAIGEPPVLQQPISSPTPKPNEARFSVKDGIVTDHSIGLQWSQDDVTEERCDHAKATAACEQLRLGGHDDWRLPTRTELLTLVDDTRSEPAIDTAAFPSCKSAWYWTRTPYAASPSDFAWVVGFGGGGAGVVHRDSYNRVRAVRGPVVSPRQ